VLLWARSKSYIWIPPLGGRRRKIWPERSWSEREPRTIVGDVLREKGERGSHFLGSKSFMRLAEHSRGEENRAGLLPTKGEEGHVGKAEEGSGV